MSKIKIPDGLVGKDLFSWLATNKSTLIAEKKFELKRADAISSMTTYAKPDGNAIKANVPISEDISTLKVSSAINTTNWMDSHDDVHLPGLWKKSLSENKDIYLLKEHVMSFETILSDDVQAFTKVMSWKDMGYSEDGTTEVLIFMSNLQKDRNPFMFNEYKMGRVKNHSVGMRYVQIEMAINDEDYKEEFSVWNKYIGQIANSETAKEKGYFFAVKEAKVIEGSAVPMGSNVRTGTLNNNVKSSLEDNQNTLNEPPTGTQKEPLIIDSTSKWLDAIKNTNFIKI